MVTCEQAAGSYMCLAMHGLSCLKFLSSSFLREGSVLWACECSTWESEQGQRDLVSVVPAAGLGPRAVTLLPAPGETGVGDTMPLGGN